MVLDPTPRQSPRLPHPMLVGGVNRLGPAQQEPSRSVPDPLPSLTNMGIRRVMATLSRWDKLHDPHPKYWLRRSALDRHFGPVPPRRAPRRASAFHAYREGRAMWSRPSSLEAGSGVIGVAR
jgi:hypothetical protein